MTFPQQNPARKTLAAAGLTLAGLLLAATAYAAAGKGNAELEAQYQREKAACTSGQSNQDKATCMREAGAAYQQARQGKLGDGQQAQYSENALKRCKILPAADQPECVRRMQNPSDLEGSVSSGGILRKEVTIVPALAQ